MHLKNANLWTVVLADLPDITLRIADWSKKNDRACSDIYGACESNQQEFIIDYKFAKHA